MRILNHLYKKGIKKLSEADGKIKELNHLIFQNQANIFYEKLHEKTLSDLTWTCKESEKLQDPKSLIKYTGNCKGHVSYIFHSIVKQ